MGEPTISTAETWTLIHEQRNKVGDLLATLGEVEWDTPSLCDGWQVRDVVAHLIQTHLVTQRSLVTDWLRSGFGLKARNARGVALRKLLSPSELLDLYQGTSNETSYLPGQLKYSLLEPVIHGEDIARPLGRHLQVSPIALVIVADLARGTDPVLGGRRRSAGLTLRATDLDWCAGKVRK